MTLCEGYYKNEKTTEKAFKDGWLGLGDMAEQDEKGFYYLVDRKQVMILSGAINVSPAEIEEVLYKHPNIKEALVIGKKDDKWGEVPVALLFWSMTEEEMHAFCSELLARYKPFQKIIILETSHYREVCKEKF